MKLVLATHNAGKLREISGMLNPLGVEVTSACQLNLPEPEETGTSFVENALIKSRAAAAASGLPALADDSGLVIPRLNGAPGIYSARWADRKNFDAAFARIQRELAEAGYEPQGVDAHFTCVLSYALPGGEHREFEGQVHGTLTFPPRGLKGFGYDPIFIPRDYSVTFAEMEPAQKDALSHRARAFDKFVAYLKSN